jgi:fumarate hydratase, class II
VIGPNERRFIEMNTRSRTPHFGDSEFAKEVWEDESPAQGEEFEEHIQEEVTPAAGGAAGTFHAMPGWRIETDSLGDIEVRADKYWGAQTERSLRYFAIGESVMPMPFVYAYGAIKAACATANAELGVLPVWKSILIAQVAAEIEEGLLDQHFPTRVYTTGSGTHLNANVNEVIANRANALVGQPMGSKHPIHPHDDVNRSQSSNDTFITAVHIALIREIHLFADAAQVLLDDIWVKVDSWRNIPKMGRTHLMDATELSVGDEWQAFASSLDRGLSRIISASDSLREIALGGTAVGNGMNAPVNFREHAITALSSRCGMDFKAPPDPFAAQSTLDSLLEVHGALRQFAAALFKFANDLRWLASGPNGGLQELWIPSNEPGSTIMPGKTNPTQSEAALMVCLRVMGNDVIMGQAAAEGNFQLNTFRPLAAFVALESVGLLSDACTSLARHMVRGTQLNDRQVALNREQSIMQLTALVPSLGYDRVARIAKRAHEEGLTPREAALEEGVDVELLRVLDSTDEQPGTSHHD